MLGQRRSRRGGRLLSREQSAAAHDAAQSALAAATEVGREAPKTRCTAVFGVAALAGGDAAAARQAAEKALQHTVPVREVFTRGAAPAAEAALACGDLDAARRSADEAAAVVSGACGKWVL